MVRSTEAELHLTTSGGSGTGAPSPGDAYDAVRECYNGYERERIDLQSDFAEKIAMVLVIRGTKPSFMGVGPAAARRAIFENLHQVCQRNGVPSGFSTGMVGHRHRPLKISHQELSAILETKMPQETTVFWASRDSSLIDLYQRSAMAEISEASLLGYPPCCASWHYDCYYAREVEASAAVYQADGGISEADMHRLKRDWIREQGFFFPQDVLVLGVYRSNVAFPFVNFIACPRCIESARSPAASLNAAASDLGKEVDPNRHAEIIDWTAGVKASLARQAHAARRAVAEHAERHATSNRGQEEYRRQCRFLFKALGVAAL